MSTPIERAKRRQEIEDRRKEAIKWLIPVALVVAIIAGIAATYYYMTH